MCKYHCLTKRANRLTCCKFRELKKVKRATTIKKKKRAEPFCIFSGTCGAPAPNDKPRLLSQRIKVAPFCPFCMRDTRSSACNACRPEDPVCSSFECRRINIIDTVIKEPIRKSDHFTIFFSILPSVRRHTQTPPGSFQSGKSSSIK